jgi:hypothetical protein
MDTGFPIAIAESLNALVELSENILRKLDGLDLVKPKSAGAFKKAVVGFKHEVLQIHADDHIARVSTSLDGDVYDLCLKQLLVALESTHAALNERLRRITSLEGDFTTLVKSTQVRALGSALETAGVAGIHKDVLQIFEGFRHLPQFQATFRRQFSDRPFYFSIDNLYGLHFQDQPHEPHVDRKRWLTLLSVVPTGWNSNPCRWPITLSFNRVWVDRYSTTAKCIGRMWVDKQLSATTLRNLGKTQIGLLQNLQKLIDRELDPFKMVFPETAQHLLDIRSSIEKEIARENSQKFIIAFCGMVKAG